MCKPGVLFPGNSFGSIFAVMFDPISSLMWCLLHNTGGSSLAKQLKVQARNLTCVRDSEVNVT